MDMPPGFSTFWMTDLWSYISTKPISSIWMPGEPALVATRWSAREVCFIGSDAEVSTFIPHSHPSEALHVGQHFAGWKAEGHTRVIHCKIVG